jgi:DNA-directed RNA polymerase specialized sigma24 family protein
MWARDQKRRLQEFDLTAIPEADIEAADYDHGRQWRDPTFEGIRNYETEQEILFYINDNATRKAVYARSLGFSNSEISSMLNISGNAIGNRVQRIRSKPRFQGRKWDSGEQ